MKTLSFLLPAFSRLQQMHAAGAQLPSLNKLLQKSSRLSDQLKPEQAFFDFRPESGAAAIALCAENVNEDIANQQWLRADPAHLRIEPSAVRLMAVGYLGLSANESMQLCKTLAPLFGDSGFLLSAAHSERWYLRAASGATLPQFIDPHIALGMDVTQCLPIGVDAKRWNLLLNEAQMLLHAHPVNQARTARGALPVNSLWIWGTGPLPLTVNTRCDFVASDDAYLRGLAKLAKIAAEENIPSEILNSTEFQSPILDLRPLRDPVKIESDWFSPALSALQSSPLAQVNIAFDSGEHYQVRRVDLYKFWRKRKVW